MKTLLVNLPWIINGNSGVRAGSRWPHIKDNTERDYLCFPFFLSYAAALLREHDFDVALIDAIASEISYEKFFEIVSRIAPNILVVETATVSLDHDLACIEQIDKAVVIILCGLDYSISTAKFLRKNPRINYVLVGEYEFTLLNLLKTLENQNNLESVAGILYRDKKGDICVNPRGELCNIDALPWPIRAELPMEKYTDAPGGMPLPNVQMIASRGCPFKCVFCAWPQLMYQGQQYRARNIEDVINEMEYLVQKMNFKSIYFDDDTFNVGRDRMLTFAKEVRIRNEERRLNVPWAIMARADLMDEEVLVNLAAAGLHTIKYGIESASQQLLDNAGKNMNIVRAEKMVKFTQSLGIKVHLTFTFGLPGETKDTIKKTIDMALALDPISLQFSITTPYPGTIYYRELEKSGMLVSKNIADYDGNHNSVIRTHELGPEQLKEAKDRANFIWGEHLEAKRGYKKIEINKHYLNRFLQYLSDYGVRYTLHKTLDFMKFAVKNNFLLRSIKKHSISNDQIAIVFHHGKICLFWSDMMITKNLGLNTSIKARDKWYDSSCAKWKLLEKKENSIKIKNSWEFIPIEQIWTVVVGKENIIHWNVEMVVKRDFNIDERKCGILVSEQYTHWACGIDSGEFPKVYDWQRMSLTDNSQRIITLWDMREIQGKFPNMKFKFEGQERAISEIQNTSREVNGRTIEARFLENKEIKRGKYNFFSGQIVLEE